MNGPDSFKNRIEQTETLISFFSKGFFLKLESNLEEWPRIYKLTHLEKSYKAMFSIFGSFTLIPNDPRLTSPIYYLSLNTNPNQQLVWTKPDGEMIQDLKQIFEELKKHIQIFETSISNINLREKQI
ncbi:LIC_13241 domain-containing protein [Leptospira interrogans serovar Hardjo-prajitno]|uniref:LIC_13241 domain-containing protein n=1 Tax=Leptospira interrogans TaxID=173 RepID=UPI003CE6F0BA